MKFIRVLYSNWKIAVDDEDEALVRQHKWYAYPYKATVYACTNKGLMVQKLLIPVVPPGYVRDHKNGCGLDNRRCNLRVITNIENVQVKKPYSNNTSGVQGVKFHVASQRWKAQISVMGERIHLGTFKHFENAVAARLEAERKYRKGTEE